MKNFYNSIHPDFLVVQELVYKPCELVINNFMQEAESQEYSACTFEINGRIIQFRIAKITPVKIGQFVTFWQRIKNDSIKPYDLTDPVDLFVVCVRDAEHFGQFVFPKDILFEKGVVSKNGKGGKRAIRVYPPWEITNSSQAQKTQAWQLKHFFEISKNSIDTDRIKKLYL